MSDALISIITPIYNSEAFLQETIQSVLDQSYEYWELILVNDGSQDGSGLIATSFSDPRIHYFEQVNKGVGAARNLGLSHVKGDYFCFLDADDVMPREALQARIEVFVNNPELSFVDGSVQYVNSQLQFMDKKYTPNFEGYPFERLLKLDDRCLFGNTWMVKREQGVLYHFQEDMTHAEDLFFYLSISNGRKYGHTKSCVLLYRQRDGSAMKNLRGLELGYIQLIKKLKRELNVGGWPVLRLKLITTKIMILSYLFDGKDLFSAIKVPFNILFA